jgi:hypothetical protein
LRSTGETFLAGSVFRSSIRSGVFAATVRKPAFSSRLSVERASTEAQPSARTATSGRVTRRI